MKTLNMIAIILVLIGALNWGLVGFLGEDLISMLGLGATVGKVIYILVFLSGLVLLPKVKDFME
jgi:hypothetical protein